MSFKSIIAFLLIVAFIPASRLKAESNFEQALRLFKENNYIEAKNLCQNEIKNKGSNYKDALIMQLLIANIYYEYKLTYESFKEFIKESDNPGAYIFALRNIYPFYDKDESDDERIDRLIELSENTKLNSTDKAHLYEDIARNYSSIFEKSKAEKYGKMIGGIFDWQIVGEFENISGSGFDKNFDPTTHPEPDYVFKNKEGAKVKWFNIIKPLNYSWIDLTQNFDCDNSIVYAQTFCESDKDQTVMFRIGVSGSLKVWINGSLCISEEEERNNGIDTYIATVNLKKGMNRILVQLGISDIERCNFFARFTDLNGNLVEGLAYTTEFQKTPIIAESNIQKNDFSAESYFKSLIEKDPNSILNYILLAKSYTTNGKLPLAIETLLQARKIAPNSSFVLIELWLAYLNNDDNTNASEIIEKVKEISPEIPLSLRLNYNEDIQNEKYPEAKEKLNLLKKHCKDKSIIYELEINLAAKENRMEDFVNLVNQAYEEYPHSETFRNIKILCEAELKKDINNAIKILETYVDEFNSNSAFNILSRLYLKNGSLNKYEKIRKILLDYNPASFGLKFDAAEIFMGIQDYSSAIDLLNECKLQAPYHSPIYENLGTIYYEKKEFDLAKENYLKCLEFHPSNFKVREKLREMEGKKQFSEYFSKPSLNEIYTASAKDVYPDGTNAAILLMQKDKVIVSGGVYEDKYTILIKILTKQGVDDFKEYTIQLENSHDYNIEKAEILKKSGGKIKGEIEDESIVFPNLQEGDAIVIVYQLRGAQYGALSEYFWDNFHFAYGYPIKDIKYSILANSKVKFDYQSSNKDFKPQIKNLDDYVLYEWQAKDVKAIETEPCMPNFIDCSPILNISSIPNWDFVSKWYNDIYLTKAKSDREVELAFKEIFPNGYKQIKPLDRAKMIYEYIVKNIRYSFTSFRQNGVIPQKASRVLTTKLGDCKDVSTLFVAFSKLAELDAYLSLVSTKNYGEKHLTLPTIDFNHAIATLNVDGAKYFIELTTDKYPFNTISNVLKDALALEINNKNVNVIQKIKCIDTNANTIKRVSELKFDKDKMTANVKTTKTGSLSGDARTYYAFKSEDERRKHIISGLSNVINKFTLETFEFNNDLTDLSEQVNYKYTLSIPNSLAKISTLYSFKPLYIDPIETFMIENEKRVFPLIVDKFMESDFQEEDITITVPQDKLIEHIPESQVINNQFGLYELKFEEIEGKIKITKKLKFYKNIIEPEEYLAFREFIGNISKFENEQIVLKDNKN